MAKLWSLLELFSRLATDGFGGALFRMIFFLTSDTPFEVEAFDGLAGVAFAESALDFFEVDTFAGSVAGRFTAAII